MFAMNHVWNKVITQKYLKNKGSVISFVLRVKKNFLLQLLLGHNICQTFFCFYFISTNWDCNPKSKHVTQTIFLEKLVHSQLASKGWTIQKFQKVIWNAGASSCTLRLLCPIERHSGIFASVDKMQQKGRISEKM